MRRLALIALAALLLAGCGLIGLPQGCPTALLEGRLVTDGGDGAAVLTEFGSQPVRWPAGYRVETQPAVVLKDGWGRIVASAGDIVYVGGGMDAADRVFIACGYVSTEPPS